MPILDCISDPFRLRSSWPGVDNIQGLFVQGDGDIVVRTLVC